MEFRDALSGDRARDFTGINEIDLAEFVTTLNRQGRSAGLKYSIETDLEDMRRRYLASRSGAILTPIFDPEAGGAELGPAIWIAARKTGEEEVVGYQALRAVDLTTTLADHLTHDAALYTTPDMGVEPEHAACHSDAAASVRGRAIYHGEVWLSPEARGHGYGKTAPRIALGVAVLRYRPDWIFGLAYNPIAHSGMLTRYGYFWNSPGGLVWRDKDGVVKHHNWLSLCRVRSDIRDLTRLVVEDWESEV